MENDKSKVRKTKATTKKEDKPVVADNNAKPAAQVPMGVYKPLPKFRGCRNC